MTTIYFTTTILWCKNWNVNIFLKNLPRKRDDTLWQESVKKSDGCIFYLTLFIHAKILTAELCHLVGRTRFSQLFSYYGGKLKYLKKMCYWYSFVHPLIVKKSTDWLNIFFMDKIIISLWKYVTTKFINKSDKWGGGWWVDHRVQMPYATLLVASILRRLTVININSSNIVINCHAVHGLVAASSSNSARYGHIKN